MASFEQDFIIFNEDTLLLRYTFTDLSGNFNSSYGLYWAAWTYQDWTNDQSGSNNASNPGNDPAWATPPEPDREKHNIWTGDGPGTSTGNISVSTTEPIVNVFFDQNDFQEGTAGKLSKDTLYYTELVISDNGNDNRSVVAATGTLYVSSSIFTTAGYRP